MVKRTLFPVRLPGYGSPLLPRQQHDQVFEFDLDQIAMLMGIQQVQ